MKVLNNILGGLAGAIALNLLHETVKLFDHDAPRVDLIGEEAITKGMEAVNLQAPKGTALYLSTLAGDIISNGFYYSLIGIGEKKHVLLRGLGYGAAAGVGALVFTKPMGLRDAPVTRTQRTKAMTIAYYTLGGLAAALTIKALRGR